jgi:hypothetical protein
VDADTVVLAAATAVVAIAQAGIVVLTRPRHARDAAFLAVPTLGLIALLIVVWLTVV